VHPGTWAKALLQRNNRRVEITVNKFFMAKNQGILKGKLREGKDFLR
jgi:hypothetical protein